MCGSVSVMIWIYLNMYFQFLLPGWMSICRDSQLILSESSRPKRDGKRWKKYKQLLNEIGKHVFLEQLRIRPWNWKLFELDLDCQVLSTKSTAAIPGTVKLDDTIYIHIYIYAYTYNVYIIIYIMYIYIIWTMHDCMTVLHVYLGNAMNTTYCNPRLEAAELWGWALHLHSSSRLCPRICPSICAYAKFAVQRCTKSQSSQV